MAYTYGAPVLKGPQTVCQHVEVPITLDTTATGSYLFATAGFSGKPDGHIYLKNVGAVASVMAIGAITATTINFTSNGTAGSYVLVMTSYSQAV